MSVLATTSSRYNALSLPLFSCCLDQAPSSDCNAACPGDHSQNCGGIFRMNVFQGTCSGLPPQPPPSPPLPAGPACSQAEVKAMPFCDPTISIDERVTDLVHTCVKCRSEHLDYIASWLMLDCIDSGVYSGRSAECVGSWASTDCKTQRWCPKTWGRSRSFVFVTDSALFCVWWQLPPFYWGTNVIHQVENRASCVKGYVPVCQKNMPRSKPCWGRLGAVQ
jgi:hypothetical protein